MTNELAEARRSGRIRGSWVGHFASGIDLELSGIFAGRTRDEMVHAKRWQIESQGVRTWHWLGWYILFGLPSWADMSFMDQPPCV